MGSASGRRVALVTGGVKGIGKAIAQELSQDYDVAVTYLNSNALTVDWAFPIKADLRREETARETIAAVIAEYGRLDAIVNNAGMIAPAAPEDYPTQALGDMFNVNVMAAQGLLAAALPHLKAGAVIVSISSVNAQLPPKGAALYGASKAALDVWTRGTAKELGARGIRVNAVAPGAINIPEAPRAAELTKLFEEMTALGRLATPQDIADAVRFLCSDQARSITGEVLTVSGGYRL